MSLLNLITGRSGRRARNELRKEALGENVTRQDLKRLSRDIGDEVKKASRQDSTPQAALKVVRSAVRGFSNINKSLSNSYDKRRPKIAQLPPTKTGMRIVANEVYGGGMSIFDMRQSGSGTATGKNAAPPPAPWSGKRLKMGVLQNQTLRGGMGHKPYFCEHCTEYHTGTHPNFLRHQQFRGDQGGENARVAPVPTNLNAGIEE